MSRSHYSIGSDVEIEMPILTVPERTPRGGSGSSSSGSGSGSTPTRTPRTAGESIDPGIGNDDPRTPVLPAAPKDDSGSGNDSPSRNPRNDGEGSRNSSGGGGGNDSPPVTIISDPILDPVLYPGPGVAPDTSQPSTNQSTDFLSQLPNFPNIDLKNLPPWAIPAGLAALTLILVKR